MLKTPGSGPELQFADESGKPREIAQARLPRYSNAFELSVHKSQGCEFDEVLIALTEWNTWKECMWEHTVASTLIDS